MTSTDTMRIVVTGGDGFIGRNLRAHLAERGYPDIVSVDQNEDETALGEALASADIVFHLAGVNRPKELVEFDLVNRGFTARVCDALARTGRSIPVVLTSSIQAAVDNPYGASKRAAEGEVHRYAVSSGARIHVLRLTNVFGKWSRPNYNSVVATFCHNIARGRPITVVDADAPLQLVYIDDVVATMAELIDPPAEWPLFVDVRPIYETTVGELASVLRCFAASRSARVYPQPRGHGGSSTPPPATPACPRLPARSFSPRPTSPPAPDRLSPGRTTSPTLGRTS